METKHRPSTGDDDVTVLRCLKSRTKGARGYPVYYEESSISGRNLISILIIDIMNYLRQCFSQLKTVGRAETFKSWSSRKGSTRWNTKKKTCPWLIGSWIVVEVYGAVCQLYWRLWNDSGDIKALWSQIICGGRRNKWEFRLTKFEVYCKNLWLGGWSTYNSPRTTVSENLMSIWELMLYFLCPVSLGVMFVRALNGVGCLRQ